MNVSIRQKSEKPKNPAVGGNDIRIARRNLFHREHVANVFHFHFEPLDSALVVCQDKFFNAVKSFINFVKPMTNLTESVFNVDFSSRFRETSLDQSRQVLNFHLFLCHTFMIDLRNTFVKFAPSPPFYPASEIRVYNRALSPDEVKRLYNMGR